MRRGWSYAESQSEFIKQDAGIAQVSFSGPVITENLVLFGSDRFGVTVINKLSGRVQWQKRFEDGVAAIPFVWKDKLYVGTESGGLHLLDLENGREAWSVLLSGPVQGAMTFGSDRLFVSTADEALHCVDPSTGKVLWTYRRQPFGGTSIKGGGNPSWIAGKVWVGFSDGALVSLNPQDGSVLWEKQFRDNSKFMDIDAKVIGWQDAILFTTYDGKLRYMKKDGTLLWDFPAGGARSPIVTSSETIFLPASEGTIYALNSAGKELWRYSLNRGVPTGIAYWQDKNVLVVASSERNIYVLNAKTGALISKAGLGGGSGSYAPVALDEPSKSFYVLSSYSRLYQFILNL